MLATTFLAALGGIATATPATQIVHPDRARTTNLSSKGDVWKLFDEQTLAGDPRAGTGGKPSTEYTAGWVGAAIFYPIEGVVDLGSVHDLTDVWYYDITGSDSIKVSCGDGRIWQTMVEKTTSGYLSWVGSSVPCTGRYVKIRLKSPSSSVTEMVLYGTAKGPATVLPIPVAHRSRTMGDLMGINGFVDDDRELLKVVGNLREYHEAQWDDGNGDISTPAYPGNRYGWAPSWVRGTGWSWNFDEFYGAMNTNGTIVSPVLQGSPAWMFGKAVGAEVKPFPPGRDSSLPASYLEHADYLYQFAARFGRAPVPTANLRVDALNTPKSGLGLLRYVEDWNEPDKDWKGPSGHFSPAVLAAMLSADYDGDQGRMGPKVGLKNADTSMKGVMPGLTAIDLEYVKAMKFWADQNRDGSFPADVLNFHWYCTDGGNQSGVSTTGISPEQDGLLQRLQAMADYRDRYLPGKELWLSEFGWDTHPQSVFRARAIAGNDEYEMQGRWIVRAFMAIAASGFDKGGVYILRDDWDVSPGTFATSGLVHDKDDATNSPKFEKKPSWFYVNALHKNLRNFRFEADESKGGLHTYRFAHATNSDSVAYVVWNQNDSAAPASVSLPLDQARIVRLAKDQPLGVSTSLAAVAGSLSLTDVSGRPELVFGKRSSTGNAAREPEGPSKTVPTHTVDGKRLVSGPTARVFDPSGIYGR